MKETESHFNRPVRGWTLFPILGCLVLICSCTVVIHPEIEPARNPHQIGLVSGMVRVLKYSGLEEPSQFEARGTWPWTFAFIRDEWNQFLVEELTNEYARRGVDTTRGPKLVLRIVNLEAVPASTAISPILSRCKIDCEVEITFGKLVRRFRQVERSMSLGYSIRFVTRRLVDQILDDARINRAIRD